MPAGRPKQFTAEEQADKQRTRTRQRSRDESADVRDIGPVPKVKNWKRRNACRLDLGLYLKTYLAASFPLPFCPDHYRVIAKAERAILEGDLSAIAMPRGTGKTEICKGACTWAVNYGHRRFVLLIGATGPATQEELLDGVRRYYDESATVILDDDDRFEKFGPGRYPLLAEDFPEIVFPILMLQGEARRQGGQTCQGQRTKIHWGGKFITMPTVPDGFWLGPRKKGPPPGGGATIRGTSITGRLRGFNVKSLRPDVVLIDDPQTDESAASPAGNNKIEKALGRTVLGVGGHEKRIAGLLPCTVIEPGDAIDRILDHAKHPEWDSERTKMLYAFPTRMDLWEKYRDIRNNYDPMASDADKKRAKTEATEFYRQNREDMQAGAQVSWPERFFADQLDGLQRAMDFYFDDKDAFFSEGQNDPRPVSLGNVEELPRAEVEKRLNGEQRGRVPHGATKLTAFIDVQGAGILFYVVCWWKNDFTGGVLDFGTFPDQGRHYFTKATLSQKFEQGDQALHSAVKTAAADLLTRSYPSAGGPMPLDLLLIDSGHQAEIIYQVCRQLRLAGFGNRILPSKGEGATESDKYGFTEGGKAEGEDIGFEWRLPPPKEARGVRLLRYNTNGWKSFVMDRIAVKDGAKGSLTFFGSPPASGERHPHLLLIDHIFAEYRDRRTSQRTGRTVDVWGTRANQDNDFWDCLVGASVAASVLRVRLEGVQQPVKQPREGRRSWAQSKAEADARR
ncbi:MAG TPA: terminase gpA endonuclease subunit [Gemmataceae bacterium]|nr:terminase gpA endonuclease subunit [Gemmataceae bacterium]